MVVAMTDPGVMEPGREPGQAVVETPPYLHGEVPLRELTLHEGGEAQRPGYAHGGEAGPRETTQNTAFAGEEGFGRGNPERPEAVHGPPLETGPGRADQGFERLQNPRAVIPLEENGFLALLETEHGADPVGLD